MMKKLQFALIFSIILGIALPAAAQTPPQSVLDNARDHFRRGIELYHDGSYQAAVIEFDRANKLAPNYKIHFNIAQAYSELQKYPEAVAAFHRYLDESGAELTAEDRASANTEIARLARRIAHVRIVTNAPGATVTIDDVTSRYDKPIATSSGRRKIVVSCDGYTAITKIVDLAGGDSVNLDFTLKPIEVKTSGAAPVPAKTDTRGMSTPFLISLASTGVLAASAGVTGYLALNEKNRNDDQISTLGVARSSLESSDRNRKNYALTTDILLGATALAAGVTVYLIVTDRHKEPTRIGLVPGGAVVSGSF